MLDDPVLQGVALTFITEGHDGIGLTEIGDIEVPGDGTYHSSGKLQVARISRFVTSEVLRPFLRHSDASLVARATYALIVLGEAVDLEPLLNEARAEGLDKYLNGMTNLAVMAIAYRNDDDDVGVLEEIYSLLDKDREYYLQSFYWKIRIMTGPKALAFRKRIRSEVGMEKLI